MSQLDGSMYLRDLYGEPANIAGSFERGMKVGDMFKKQQADSLMKEAYKQGVTTNPDGSTSFDGSKTMSALYGKGMIREAQEFQAQQQKQDLEKQKMNFDGLQTKALANSKIVDSIFDQASLEKGRTDALVYNSQEDVDRYLPKVYDEQYMSGLRKKFGRASMPYQEQAEQDRKTQEAAARLAETQQNNYFKRAELDLQTRKTEKELQNSALSEGEKALDKDYAKDFNDFTSSGYNEGQAAIAKLEQFKEEILKDSGLVQAGGGPIAGSLPDAFRTEESIARRDNIVSIANKGLKAIFGGAGITDSERKAAAAEYYNDKLSNQQNAKILERKIQDLRNGLEVQAEKAKHYSQNKTLRGFQFTGNRPQPQKKQITPQDAEALFWAEKNPNDPRAAKIVEKLRGAQ